MLDCLLVNPQYPLLEEPLQEHLGLGYVASVARAHGYRVEILDASLRQMSHRKLVEEILRRSPALLGITIIYQNAATEQLSIVPLLRKKGYRGHITAGGYFPTLAPRPLLETQPLLDSVVRGEGEETVVELLGRLGGQKPLDGILGLTCRARDGEIVENPPRPLIPDLDALPFPARDELPWAFQRGGCVTIVGSRGCWARCSFCSIYTFYDAHRGPRWRGRSAGNLLDELEEVVGRFGVRKIKFEDAIFFGPGPAGRRRARAIAQGILDRGLKIRFRFECRAEDVDEEVFQLLREAGLDEVFVGIESGVQRTLDDMRKDIHVESNIQALETLRRLRIRAGIGFIAFDPRSTIQEFAQNIEFVRRFISPMMRELGSYCDPFGRLQVFAGTAIYEDLKAKGKIDGDIYSDQFVFEDPSMRRLYRVLSPVIQGIYSVKGWLRKAGLARRRQF